MGDVTIESYRLLSQLPLGWQTGLARYEPPHGKTTVWLCAQSDKSLRCPHEETLGP